jgi:excisionase family DNA binding protein
MTVVVLTPEQLEDLVERAIARALDRGPARTAGEWLSTEEAAEAEGVSPKTVRSWVAAGLPAQRRGRRLVISRAILASWRAGTSVTPDLLSTLTSSGQ